MADYGRNKQEKHAFQQFQQDMKDGAVEGLVVLCGIEDYLINWSSQIIVDRFVNPVTKSLDYDLINLETATADDIIASCETAPMLSEKKVVLIRDYKNEFADAIGSYGADMPETTVLIVAGESVKAEVKKHAKVYDFEPLNQPQLISFINKRFKAAGKEASRGIITTLINESGYYNKDIDYNLYNLEGDVKKIIALCDGTEITLDHVRDGISRNIEHGIFALLDAISGNRKDIAFDLLHQILLSGEPDMKLLGAIIGQLEIMLMCKQLSEDGCQLAEIKKLTKLHEFRIKKALNFSKKFTEKDLKRILKNAYNTDKNIKSGQFSSQLAFEMLIAEI